MASEASRTGTVGAIPIYDRMMKRYWELKKLRAKLVSDADQTPLKWNGTLNVRS